MNWGSPGAGKLHAGEYEELTSLRQRGGGGWNSLQPPPYPLKKRDDAVDPAKLLSAGSVRASTSTAKAEYEYEEDRRTEA